MKLTGSLRSGFEPREGTRLLLRFLEREAVTLRMSAAALADHGLIVACAAVGWWAARHGLLGLPTVLLAWLIVTQRLRALENLVHYGGHGHFSRTSRRWNDFLTDVLAGAATFSCASGIRTSHNGPHHVGLAIPNLDPDLRRLIELRADELEGLSGLALMRALLVRLPRYALGFWRTVGGDARTLVRGLAFHAAAWLGPAMLVLGPAEGVGAYALTIVVPILLLVPFRFLAELEEHLYSAPASIVEATPQNEHRWAWLLHPHADGEHLMHHLFPNAPFWELRRLRLVLERTDPEFRRRVRRRRTYLGRMDDGGGGGGQKAA